MEALSIALVLIFVMWLIDKHNAWKRTGKIALVVVALAVFGLGGVYGWAYYEDWKATKARAAVDAAAAAQHDAQVKACIARFPNADQFDRAACEVNPDSIPQSNVDPYAGIATTPPKRPAPLHHVRSTNDADLMTTEYGALICGHVKAGQVAVLIQDDGTFIKVKTSSGQVGWSAAYLFEKVD